MAIGKSNDNPSDRELRQFAGIWFPLFWAVVAFWMYLGGASRLATVAVAIGLITGGIGIVRVAFIRPIFLLWMSAAYPIGYVVSHLILGAIYFLLVTPIGAVMRLVRYDALRLRRPEATTYWVNAHAPTAKASYFRQL